MYDPLTLVWRLSWPKWLVHIAAKLGIGLKGYSSFLEIWHVDPETDGSDNSCDWFGGRNLSEADEKLVEELVGEDRDGHYLRSRAILDTGVVINPRYRYKSMPAGLMYPLVFGVWRTIAWRRDRRERIGPKEMIRIFDLVSNPVDNLQALLVNNDGYLADDDERVREFIQVVMGCYIRFHRPWYRHPRWHIRHWKIQIPAIQRLKRWAFSRCSTCGGRFSWGYSPVTNSYGSTGPRWFRGEPGVHHFDCIDRRPVNDPLLRGMN